MKKKALVIVGEDDRSLAMALAAATQGSKYTVTVPLLSLVKGKYGELAADPGPDTVVISGCGLADVDRAWLKALLTEPNIPVSGGTVRNTFQWVIPVLSRQLEFTQAPSVYARRG